MGFNLARKLLQQVNIMNGLAVLNKSGDEKNGDLIESESKDSDPAAGSNVPGKVMGRLAGSGLIAEPQKDTEV